VHFNALTQTFSPDRGVYWQSTAKGAEHLLDIAQVDTCRVGLSLATPYF